MNKKCAVFSCLGLGDGLISLVLAQNLSMNGHEVIAFHPFLKELQSWFSHLKIREFPTTDELPSHLKEFDHFYIFFEKSDWIQEIIAYCETHYPDKTTVLNPIATSNTDYPYWENGRFNGNLSFVDNLEIYCREILKLPVVVKNNGMQVPKDVIVHRYPSRVVIHPTSSRSGKNWPLKKYLELSSLLRENGYDPVLIVTEEEKRELKLQSETPKLDSLEKRTIFIAESGYMIGNDSGVGHLASCLGLPTLTICRNKQIAQFWRPAWSKGMVITPPSLVPNLKGFRWRDKFWKHYISVSTVQKAFLELAHKS